MEIEERPIFFACGSLSLAGILSVPAQPSGIAVLIPWGGGAYPSSGRNRIRTRMARTFAEQGFHAFRFDYQGVGESEGRYRKRDLDEPYSDDIIAASEWLTSQGHDRVVVVANCFGGWSSLLSAERIPGLEAMAVINTPVRRDHIEKAAKERPLRWWMEKLKRVSLRKLRTPEVRKRYRKMAAAKASAIVGAHRDDARFATAVKWLVDRDIPLLLLYGQGGFRSDFEAELDRGLREVVEKAGPLARVLRVEEFMPGYGSLPSQTAVLREITQWLGELPVLERSRAD